MCVTKWLKVLGSRFLRGGSPRWEVRKCINGVSDLDLEDLVTVYRGQEICIGHIADICCRGIIMFSILGTPFTRVFNMCEQQE